MLRKGKRDERPKTSAKIDLLGFFDGRDRAPESDSLSRFLLHLLLFRGIAAAHRAIPIDRAASGVRPRTLAAAAQAGQRASFRLSHLGHGAAGAAHVDADADPDP